MVEPDYVKESKISFESRKPETVAVLSFFVPVIYRHLPNLPLRRESIRGSPRRKGRLQFAVKLEGFLIRPDIGTVRSSEEREVSDDQNIISFGIFMERLPLSVKYELDQRLIFYLFT